MKMLTPGELEELRKDIADLQIPSDRIDEIIRILDAIAASFVYQAFGKSPVQLSLAGRANKAFTGDETHDSLPISSETEIVDPGTGGANNTNRHKGRRVPQTGPEGTSP